MLTKNSTSNISKLALIALSAAAIVSACNARAEVRTKPITIGVLTDLAGSYSDDVGPGTIIAAQLAIDDAGGKAGNLPIQLISADMQLKVDLATSISREWIDTRGVDVILDVPVSPASLAVSEIVKNKDKILLSAAGTSDLTDKLCNRNTVQWAFNNYSLATALTNALLKEEKKSWFYITADYAFGIDIAGISMRTVKEHAGTVIGEARQPLGVVDQSSAVLKATSSGASVIALANGGTDTQNSVKQLSEFGVGNDGKQTITIFSVGTRSIAAMGLDKTQGVYAAMPFYWDLNENTRAWSKRFMEKSNGKPPSHQQAATYAFVTHYIKAMKAHPTTSGSEILDVMKRMPTDDPLFGKGTLRADGSHIHPLYLFKVKSPKESTGQWDVVKLVSTIDPALAFISATESSCPLLKQ